ncbi:MAG: KH domain-containing protein [Tissierellia bacterium]|nr:KH domain-containing protein [Tissierellia bacterium]
MIELIEYMAKELVDLPEEVTVTEVQNNEEGIVMELRVASEDMGKVIGKNGRIAKALRSIINAVAKKDNLNIQLSIVDKNE